jgi:hypothetical protein
MATRFSNALFPDNSITANFRAWTQFIEDTLVTTGGWVVTADTGQTLPNALVVPTAGSQKRGYRIYRMNDSLQSAAPVFMRLDYGSGSSLGLPGIWVTIGTGSDGTGNITGILWNGGTSSLPNIGTQSTSTSTANNSYGSASTSRFSLALFVQTGAGFHFIFTLERSKDSSGNDTGSGLLLIYRGGGDTNIARTRYLSTTVGPQPSEENGLAYVITGQNPTQTLGGDIGVGVISHFRGTAQQPGTNFVVVTLSDVAAEGSFQMTLYGQLRTYQHCSGIVPAMGVIGGIIADNSARVCIRYD